MSKKLPVEPYKGVRDFYPEDSALLRYLLSTYRDVCERYGYVEYKASVLEPAELYKAKGADNEELLNDQTYTFVDRGDREVTLRPEMTPTVARMVAAKRRELGFPLRYYSIPNVFRYERPQRGRLREHWQLNVDIFGSRSLAADAEIIKVAYEVMRAFGAKDEDFVIKLGSRKAIEALAQERGLSADKYPALFALLDRKDKLPAEELEARSQAQLGMSLAAFIPSRTPDDIASLLGKLESMGVTNAVYDSAVVRGFNYYTGSVFEVFDTHPHNNRALFGGGRYDNLTALFDNEPLPGAGFGMGDVTMRDFLEVRGLLPAYVPPTKVYVAVTSTDVLPQALALAEELRAQNVDVASDFGEKKLGDQIKTAAKHKIPWLIVVGEEEVASGTFGVKNLESGAEEKLNRSQLAEFFSNV